MAGEQIKNPGNQGEYSFVIYSLEAREGTYPWKPGCLLRLRASEGYPTGLPKASLQMLVKAKSLLRPPYQMPLKAESLLRQIYHMPF